ncbi:DUF421 domain-containing protein [Melissococcus plutonius]|uniref:Membrane protein yetF n=2 Tax=Melissococcus plutonius TaxID=33970 RepID=F3YCT4_MELPT|nr:DUF421 domain-containing protein [Melissococcus plutonius]BAL62900.1 hypothetical protein MPD5_1718 [Melissococcus plutonius DAT561]AIM26047.1 hypothetical protein MEPL_178p000700 [Melissococcus plutonius S1]KMT23507.1 hypothetical protein MEPL2_5c00160 [Melissococcus plutonius]KMT23681.1 hypothetical protein MEPL3_9c00810 [Melissococcus plutonius]KMT23788.1 hypothetical protein MEPL1_11c00710 [Melissococcus plutonius]
MPAYNLTFIKLGLGIVCLVIQINLTGRSNIAPSSTLDQVENFVLGGIIGGVIYNDSISILQFVLVLLLWTLLVLIVKFIREHNRFLKNFIDGKPVTLIKDGKINIKECLQYGISANDLMFKLRSNKIFQVEPIKRAILEQNGQLTITKFGEQNVYYPLIVDGQINPDVLEAAGKDINWLNQQIKEKNYKNVKEIYLGEYLSGKLTLYGYNDKED